MTNPQTDLPTERERLSIADRAARRDRLSSADRDRYANLLRSLQAGREIPLREARKMRFEWHPVALTLLKLAALVVIVYFAGNFAWNVWRDAQVETWAGSDASVQSGQRLAGCIAANAMHDELFPTWLRYGGRVYLMTTENRPVGNEGQLGEGYERSGYTLGNLQLLLLNNSPQGLAREELVVHNPPAFAGRVFRVAPECA
jgi:hypothetical protein